MAALSCIGEYSHANNYSKRIMALYLYATGAQRQAITVLSTIGLSESYTNLTSINLKRHRKKRNAESRNLKAMSHRLLILKQLLHVLELSTNYLILCALKHSRLQQRAST